MKQVLDTRIDIRVLASLHEYFSKENINLTKSKLGTLTLEFAYEVLLANNLVLPNTEASAQHYLNQIMNTKTKLDVTKIVIPTSINESIRQPSPEDVELELKRLKNAREGVTDGH